MIAGIDVMPITRLEVNAPGGDYPVLIGDRLLDGVGSVCAEKGLGHRVVVATDTNVGPLYGERVLATLRSTGFEATLATMPAGEAHKRGESVSGFVDAFAAVGLARDGWVLALGGGVVGDTAG